MLKFYKGDDIMGRPVGTKNNMRSPKEKEEIVLEYINGSIGFRQSCNKYNISMSTLNKWVNEYQIKGINGLKSNTGKIGLHKGNFKRTEIEKLKEELLKKEIELMRLKKGYVVKGVGAKKEYVSILDVNIK